LPPPRLARQRPFTLPAGQNETFIDLDDASKPLILNVFPNTQKAMPPAERGARVDAGPHRRRTDALREVQGVGIFQPAVPLAKPGKRRAGQSIERSGAGLAFITLMPPRHTVTVDVGPDLRGEKHRNSVELIRGE
jgi:hypothetical protein